MTQRERARENQNYGLKTDTHTEKWQSDILGSLQEPNIKEKYKKSDKFMMKIMYIFSKIPQRSLSLLPENILWVKPNQYTIYIYMYFCTNCILSGKKLL